MSTVITTTIKPIVSHHRTAMQRLQDANELSRHKTRRPIKNHVRPISYAAQQQTSQPFMLASMLRAGSVDYFA